MVEIQYKIEEREQQKENKYCFVVDDDVDKKSEEETVSK